MSLISTSRSKQNCKQEIQKDYNKCIYTEHVRRLVVRSRGAFLAQLLCYQLQSLLSSQKLSSSNGEKSLLYFSAPNSSPTERLNRVRKISKFPAYGIYLAKAVNPFSNHKRKKL